MKIARIIASALGIDDSVTKATPEELINIALQKTKKTSLPKESLPIIHDMVKTAIGAGIDFDKTLIPSQLKEELADSNEESELDDLSDTDLDKMADSIDDFDDVVDAYDDHELYVADEDGNHVADIDDLEGMNESNEPLNEILSRRQRLKAAIRFKQSASKRHRKLKLALHSRSNTHQMNARARHIAIKQLKERIGKKPVSQMSFQEKERVERIVARRGSSAINRLAMKLVPRLRKLESTRLHPKSK